MFTQAELETLLTIGFVLACVNIWWILSGREIKAVRRAFAWWVMKGQEDHRVESYVKGLRELANDDSYNKTYTNLNTEQITLSRKKARN